MLLDFAQYLLPIPFLCEEVIPSIASHIPTCKEYTQRNTTNTTTHVRARNIHNVMPPIPPTHVRDKYIHVMSRV